MHVIFDLSRKVHFSVSLALVSAISDIINFHAQKVARKHILSRSAQGLVGKTEHDRYR